MPPWEVLLIPLIAFGVWILSTLLKGEDEKARKLPPRRAERGNARGARRPTTALDSFLEEARRRRAAAAGMDTMPEPARPVPPPMVPARRSVSASRPAAPRRPVIATVIEEPVVIRREVVLEQPPEALAVPKPSTASRLPTPLPPAPPAPVLKRDRPASPVLLEVLRLLRSPKTAGTAVVLREILDRPFGRPRRGS